MENQYKRTIAGSVGAGMGAIFNGSGRSYYILEHKTQTEFHKVGESQKIIVDQVELGRDSSCQVRFDELCETVSRKHAAIVKDGENWKIIPLSQTNATLVNGQRIDSDCILRSGDEIQLSSHGPIMGFIIPQGEKSLVKSIGMTERLNLFRQQALRPYKTALIITAIVLVLAVAGLVTLNVLQNKAANAKIDAQGETIAAQQQRLSDANDRIEDLVAQDEEKQKQLADLTQKAEDAEAERIAAQASLDSLKNQTNATQEALTVAQERVQKAESVAASASQSARAARNAADDMKKQLAEAKAAAEKEQQALESLEVEASNLAAKASKASAKVEKVVEETVKEFADIESCKSAVYFIKMDNIVVWDAENRVVVDLNCDNLHGGTGFLLEDGRFVTARRVVEPWLYFINSEEKLRTFLGRDNNGSKWYFEDIQVCVNSGLKVIANYTAYSPTGANFQFKNTDMAVEKSMAGVKQLIYPDANKTVLQLNRVRAYDLYWMNTRPDLDWATMQKNDQLHTVKGLKFSNSYSNNPVGGTEVIALGYPQDEGFENSQSVSPILSRNNINVSGLNDQNVIELSSRRYKVGNDGSPALIQIDGEWTVIGILGHTDESDRDCLTPISNIRK